MEAEDARPRVGPLARVDDGAGRVEQPAGQEQRGRCGARLAEDLRQGDHDHPAHPDVGQRDREPRRVDPHDAEHDARGAAPAHTLTSTIVLLGGSSTSAAIGV